jgi:hypothetical protein
MHISPLTSDQVLAIQAALEASWPTQSAYYKDVPELNMCGQTAVVVCERFGGEIMKTIVRNKFGHEIEHFYNCIGGNKYDFTESQFLTTDFKKNPSWTQPTVATIEEIEKDRWIDLPIMRGAFSKALNL